MENCVTRDEFNPDSYTQMKKTREEIEQIAEVVVDAMLKVHRALGPGLLESAFSSRSLRLGGESRLRPTTQAPR